MNYEALLAARERPVRAGLIGAGEFGRSLIVQSRAVAGLELSVVCDHDVARARDALGQAGFSESELTFCESAPEATRAIEAGKRVVTADAAVCAAAPIDVLVEATGNPEAAVANVLAAIENRRHVAMVTKEGDSVVGPWLHARARETGLVYTPVDGDQPSLLIGLVSWVRRLGLEIVAAGKSSEYDFVVDLETERVGWRGKSFDARGVRDLWTLPEGARAAGIVRRGELLGAIPQRTVPDLCEMGMVANATGLLPDTPALHVPVARIVEVPSLLCPRVDGGILESRGVVDVFNCLRRPDEASFAGGVFVVVACRDRDTWRVLRDKGHLVSDDLGYAMMFNAQHLLGVEAPISILSAGLLGLSTGGLDHRPVVDLVAHAERDFRAGEVLAITDAHHHEVAGLGPCLVPAGPASAERPLPYYMAVGRRLARDVAAGSAITRDDIVVPDDSTLWRVRAEHDARFFGGD